MIKYKQKEKRLSLHSCKINVTEENDWEYFLDTVIEFSKVDGVLCTDISDNNHVENMRGISVKRNRY